jgi:hypothetical protein
MQRPTLAVVVFVSLLGFAGSAKADTIEFSFVSTPNLNGTYVDAWGTLTGILSWSTNPADLNLFLVDDGLNSGSITVVSNVPPSPTLPAHYPQTPELNGSSDMNGSHGGYEFVNSPAGITVSNASNQLCNVCFQMPGNPADGGDFYFIINASGLNGEPGNSDIDATNDGFGYAYAIGGTLTLDGQVGAYDLTPEPPSWLLLASGIALLGFMFYRRPTAVAHLS